MTVFYCCAINIKANIIIISEFSFYCIRLYVTGKIWWNMTAAAHELSALLCYELFLHFLTNEPHKASNPETSADKSSTSSSSDVDNGKKKARRGQPWTKKRDKATSSEQQKNFYKKGKDLKRRKH